MDKPGKWAGALTNAALGQAAAAVSEVAEAVSGWAGLGKGESPLPVVRFQFESDGAPEVAWRVLALNHSEGLSRCYAATVELATEDLGAEPEALLGKDCRVVFERESLRRRLCGIVSEVERRGSKAGNLLTRVTVVPALWASAQRTNHLVFQHQNVVEILSTLLSKALEPYHRTVNLDKLRDNPARAYPPREYCIQFAESDLKFALRLMQEEGIAFYFDHSGDREEMVLVDANEPYLPITTADDAPLKILGPEADSARYESLRTFDLKTRMQPTKVVLRDFGFTRIVPSMGAEAGGTDGNQMTREIFEYPAAPTQFSYDRIRGYTEDDLQAQATLRTEVYRAGERVFSGTGNVTGLTPGQTFEVTGHGNAAFDGKYLITEVQHTGFAPEETTDDAGEPPNGRQARYQNRFTCIPADVVFRPERTLQRPKISSVLTATVVGPQGQEIHADEHGRVRVQFHWDRVGAMDEKSSCFVRVKQSWAGPGFGFQFIPRIGMEVVVDFIEGNPDRPIVTGCVYNTNNPAPYPPDETSTKSYIRTNSSPGGEGYNELRFEDAKGHEEVYFQAEKDFNELVKHNHVANIQANETKTVGVDQTLTVKANRTKTVKKDETITVEKNRKTTVVENDASVIQGTRTVTVMKKDTEHFDDERETTVVKDEKLTVNAGRLTNITKDDQKMVKGSVLTEAKEKVAVIAGKDLWLNQSGNSLKMLPDGTTVDTSSGRLVLTNSSGQIKMDTNIIEVAAMDELHLKCGLASLVMKKDGTIEINGAQSSVKVDASQVAVSSAMIKLN
jgi:type VI secretion system secreted protein VgrG